MDGLSNDLPQIPLNAPLHITQGRAKLRWMRQSKEVRNLEIKGFPKITRWSFNSFAIENGP